MTICLCNMTNVVGCRAVLCCDAPGAGQMVAGRKRSRAARLRRAAQLSRGPVAALFCAPSWLHGKFTWTPTIYGASFDSVCQVRSDREFRTQLRQLSSDVTTLVLAPAHGTVDGFVLWGSDSGPRAIKCPLHRLIESVFCGSTIDRLLLHACNLGRALVDACRYVYIVPQWQWLVWLN